MQPTSRPKQNVLVIAYYFPPLGLSGVQRTLKFVKYLPEFGWRPIVLTVGEAPYYAKDESLMAEIQPLVDSGDIIIYRTEKSGAPGVKLARKAGDRLKLPRSWWQRLRSKLLQVFLQPDSRIGWRKPALQMIDRIYAENEIDAVFATAPPYTDFLIARDVKRKYGTPVLLDYRDAWAFNPVLNFYITPFHKAYARKLEDECLRASDEITVVNRKMKEILIANYPFITHEDVDILPHGFDPEDFEGVGASDSRETFRITYAGAFYVGRNPKVFFEAVKIALKREPSLASDLELVFAGLLQPEYLKHAEKLGIRKLIVEKGYLDHRESVRLLIDSDVLWMTMSDDLSAPGKLYEYFGSRNPILGLVPKNSQAETMLRTYRLSWISEPKDPDQTANNIIELYHLWQQKKLDSPPNQEFVQSFDRRKLTEQLSHKLAHMMLSKEA